MKFFIILAAVFATVAIAGPAAAPAAAPTDDMTNSPAGHQAAENNPAPAGCFWAGTAPFCCEGCPSGYNEVSRGKGGDSGCCFIGYKALCC
jgi:hypothetical protein